MPHSRKGTKPRESCADRVELQKGTKQQAHSGACFSGKWKVCPCPFQVAPDPQSIIKGFAVLRQTRALLEERQLRGNFIQEDRQVSHKIQFAKDQRLILRHPAHHSPSCAPGANGRSIHTCSAPPALTTLFTG